MAQSSISSIKEYSVRILLNEDVQERQKEYESFISAILKYYDKNYDKKNMENIVRASWFLVIRLYHRRDYDISYLIASETEMNVMKESVQYFRVPALKEKWGKTLTTIQVRLEEAKRELYMN